MNNNDITKIMGWVGGTLAVLMISVLGYFGSRTMNTLDQINNNLTTIVVQQSTMQQKIATLEAASEANLKRWDEQDKTIQEFWRNYDVPLRKTH